MLFYAPESAKDTVFCRFKLIHLALILTKINYTNGQTDINSAFYSNTGHIFSLILLIIS